MKTNVIAYLILFFFTAPVVCAQTSTPSSSVFDGTWKWEGQNKILLVYISTDELIDEGNETKHFELDYQMKNSQGEVLYNSKVPIEENGDVQQVFSGIGASLIVKSEGNLQKRAIGQILDFGNGGYKGVINLKHIVSLDSEPSIIWKLKKYTEQWADPNDPKDFTLPTDITLTKVD